MAFLDTKFTRRSVTNEAIPSMRCCHSPQHPCSHLHPLLCFLPVGFTLSWKKISANYSYSVLPEGVSAKLRVCWSIVRSVGVCVGVSEYASECWSIEILEFMATSRFKLISRCFELIVLLFRCSMEVVNRLVVFYCSHNMWSSIRNSRTPILQYFNNTPILQLVLRHSENTPVLRIAVLQETTGIRISKDNVATCTETCEILTRVLTPKKIEQDLAAGVRCRVRFGV